MAVGEQVGAFARELDDGALAGVEVVSTRVVARIALRGLSSHEDKGPHQEATSESVFGRRSWPPLMRRKQRDFRNVATDVLDLAGATAERTLAWKVGDTPLRAKDVISGTLLAALPVLVLDWIILVW